MGSLKQILLIVILGIFLTGCSTFSLLMSGSGVVVSQNTYVKIYNGIDVLSVINTDKSIKGHIYDNTIGLFGNKH